MPELNLSVTAGADDAFERASGVFNAVSVGVYIIRSNDPATQAAGGFRFQNVTIPSGSTIVSAYIELYAYDTNYDDSEFTLYGNAVADAANFVDEADIYGRARTTAFVTFSDTGVGIGWYGNTYEIKAILQEIIDEPLWASNNSLALLAIGGIGSNKLLAVRTYEGDPALAALLYVSYTALPDTPTNTSPANESTSQSLTPTLVASAYSGDGTHAASQWQITATSGDYSSPIFDSGEDAVNLEGIAVTPALTLVTTYYWRVRYKNESGWSTWSNETSFTTLSLVTVMYITTQLPKHGLELKMATRQYITVQKNMQVLVMKAAIGQSITVQKNAQVLTLKQK